MKFIASPSCKQIFFEGGPSRLQPLSCCSPLWTAAEEDLNGSGFGVSQIFSQDFFSAAEVVQEGGGTCLRPHTLLWSPACCTGTVACQTMWSSQSWVHQEDHILSMRGNPGELESEAGMCCWSSQGHTVHCTVHQTCRHKGNQLIWLSPVFRHNWLQ